jgi:hypothetical protein
LIIAELKNQLVTCQGAVDPVEQGRLLNLITDMLSDFQSRWGESVTYFSDTIRAERNRQKGIPAFLLGHGFGTLHQKEAF